MNKTTYLSNKLLDHTLRNTAFTSPTTVYLALFDENPTIAGTQTSEVTGGDYARQAITFGSAATQQIANSAAVTFPTASADWNGGDPIGFGGIMDASSAGNMLYFGPLTVAVTILTGGELELGIGQIQIEET
jgi:hypothetical protein